MRHPCSRGSSCRQHAHLVEWPQACKRGAHSGGLGCVGQEALHLSVPCQDLLHLLCSRQVVADGGALDGQAALQHEARVPVAVIGVVIGRVAGTKVEHRHLFATWQHQRLGCRVELSLSLVCGGVGGASDSKVSGHHEKRAKRRLTPTSCLKDARTTWMLLSFRSSNSSMRWSQLLRSPSWMTNTTTALSIGWLVGWGERVVAAHSSMCVW